MIARFFPRTSCGGASPCTLHAERWLHSRQSTRAGQHPHLRSPLHCGPDMLARRTDFQFSSMLIAAVSLLLTSCQEEKSPASSESRYLKAQTVPAIINWGKSGQPRLDMRQLNYSIRFDELCLVQEYGSLKKTLGPKKIEAIYGFSDDMVPELHTALIGIKQHTAHVAIFPASPLYIYNPTNVCVAANKAMLQMGRRKNGYSRARLEEVQ